MKMLAVCLLVFMGIAQIRAGGSDMSKMSGTCPSGWAQYNGFCYRYFPTHTTWDDAESCCNSMNAHLASVHSCDQNSFIQKVIREASCGDGETWIGGSECGSTWSWTDGSPFDYTNWCYGRPSCHHHKRCLQMNYGGGRCWDNLQCWKKRPFVCSKPMC